ncbi:MAG: pilus assembly protein PilM [Candidatus Magasanikbacteria bacterium]
MSFKNKIKKYSSEFDNFISSLSSRPEAGGLQITDSSIQYVSLSEGESDPVYFSVKLPPGVVENGRVEKEEKLVSALKKLFNKVNAKKEEDREKVVVSLPSNVVYTQNFNIPKVEEGRLEETASLNLEMISPIPSDEAYMSWEIIEESDDNFGLLGAFVQKDILDNFRSALLQSNFHPIAIEAPSLSISWLMNKIMGPKSSATLVVNVSSDGIDLSLIKNGYVYFDYFKSWNSVKTGSGQISQSAFKSAISQEVSQVISFTESHFKEGLQEVYFIAPGIEKKVKSAIEQNFGFSAKPLRVDFVSLDPSWYTVLGSALRAEWPRNEDRFISLGTGKVETVYYREQLIDFINLWRNIWAGALVMFILLFGSVMFLIKSHPLILKKGASGLNIDPHKKDLKNLRQKAERFNDLVASIKRIRKKAGGAVEIVKEVQVITKERKIRIVDLKVDGSNGKVELSAEAPSYDKVIGFKDALIRDSRFSNVELPFSNINTGSGDFVSFGVSFKYKNKSNKQS